MASVFIASRLKSSSWPWAKSVFQAVGNVSFRLPSDGRLPFAGIVKSNPGRQGAKAPNQREKNKIQNKMTHCDTYQIPAYSLSYLINSDPTGLSDLEIELIDGFLAARSNLFAWLVQELPTWVHC
jgi:hypothetical protein